MDLYGPILAKALFPAFEAARGRPTVPLLRYLEKTQFRSSTSIEELQVGLLRRLVRQAYLHTPYYRDVFDDREVHFDDFHHVADLAKLPLLEHESVRPTRDARTTAMPHNTELRHWRDATRWRAYGWAGYRIGMRALHYTHEQQAKSLFHRGKIALDHALKRDVYCSDVADAVAQMQRFRPDVIISDAAGELARYVNSRDLRDWENVPVIAEHLARDDRSQIERAFGPTFETYGTIASECEAHDGMHIAMETMIVEVIVRLHDGGVRAAYPGERGEIVITDLHDLASPLIRFVTGDTAVAREAKHCPCGRTLAKLGSIG
jgi:phenylacetate-CoA ligase